jgi:hypothetical protein
MASSSEDLARIRIRTTLVDGRFDLQVWLRVVERASTRYGWSPRVIDDGRDDLAVEQPRRP